MIVSSCLQEDPSGSSTDEGDGIGRLQLLLGEGGVGKSFVIDAVLTTLKSKHDWSEDNFSVYATTGKAAISVGGSTVHNYKDGIGFFGERFRDLSPKTLQSFQARMRRKKLIIIDEFSMLRQYELAFIDRRLKQIMCSTRAFGGLTIVLGGDPGQLPPVQGNCLWNKKAKLGSKNWEGFLAYQLFDTAMKLVENKRLDFSDPEAVRYNDFLKRVRDGKNTIEDWKYITGLCSQHSMPRSRWTAFSGDDVVHLYTTNKEVAASNAECIKKLDSPIVKVEAEHTGEGKKATSNTASGLDLHAFYCKGALVLLTKNVCQSLGLCNGSTGKIVDIIYTQGKPPPALPECIIVDFGDNYSGPSFIHDDDSKKGWVPIFPNTSEWVSLKDNELVQNSRTMFPLCLCYAWTIWKAQGQTIRGKVVVSLGEKEKEHCISYTAFS